MARNSPNVYCQLLDKHIEALTKLNKYQKKCTTVELHGSVRNTELRWIHEALDHHFPELVSSRRISEGGGNKMTLVAKPDDIKAALELILSEYPKINSSPLADKIKELINKLEPEVTIKLNPNYYG